jgi:hypothetical protein
MVPVREPARWKWLVAGLAVLGTLSRLLPLLDLKGRLLRQFPTEDGYLMMTIARNLALGNGMSTAEGWIPTNGTQPGFNLVEALCFWLVGGQRRTGVLMIELVQCAVAMLAAWSLYSLGKHILHERSWGARAAALAAAFWYASANVVPHTMNCLETGAYVLMVLTSVGCWQTLWEKARDLETPLLARAAWVGVVLGATFWVRIDAIFLIGALTVAHVAWAWPQGRKRFFARLGESLIAGGVSLAIAAPWLLYNRIRFGHFMPISGLAESGGSAWFHNTALLPAALFRYVTLVAPIPHESSTRVPVILVCGVIVLAWGYLVLRAMRVAQSRERWLMTVASVLLAALSVYYGMAFGAGHFLDRYLFPASPFIALFSMSLLLATAEARPAFRLGRGWLSAVGALLFVATAGLHLRAYWQGDRHMHFQVVAWADRHVPSETWVAAVQTGTLGFFHDRTVNLDGKVNPEALAMRVGTDRIPEYVVDSRWGAAHQSIDYLLDWRGLAVWQSLPAIRSNFDLLVDDAKVNLAVFRRKKIAD